jgi:1,4-dihydroxy-6-naphthoate synthase
MKLNIGFSPCPNDTFIFDALVHGKIDTKGITFEPYLEDVEALNKNAKEGKYDITKLSFHAYAYVYDKYILMDSGSALGNNCGPLLISKTILPESELQSASVAIPGEWTTANFLLGLAYPQIKNKTAVVFSEIENKILNEKYDLGVIIHENRFTYQQKGLHLIQDLGSWWESETQMPIPLGGIAIKRVIDKETAKLVQELIRESILFAQRNPQESEEYIRCHAQEMDKKVTQEHINLYVNDFSIRLGEKGKNAIELMYQKGFETGILPFKITDKLFI